MYVWLVVFWKACFGMYQLIESFGLCQFQKLKHLRSLGTSVLGLTLNLERDCCCTRVTLEAEDGWLCSWGDIFRLGISGDDRCSSGVTSSPFSFFCLGPTETECWLSSEAWEEETVQVIIMMKLQTHEKFGSLQKSWYKGCNDA